MPVISWVLVIFASLLALLAVMLLVEVVVAIALRSRRGSQLSNGPHARPRVAVVVPAHNESSGIWATVGGVKAQLQAGDRLVVVADNCTDDTAAIAAAAGAEVVERHDQSRVGKGYALDFGFRHLRADPPRIVFVIDADCHLSPGAIDGMARFCAATERPAQALDLMVSSDRAPINHRVAEFAWRVRNWVRPLGMSVLGLPCRLMGTGMAFPWQVICSVELASGEIAEDQKLGFDLTAAGHAPLFYPDAVVTSKFPASVAGAKTQRQRWEHGHLGLIVTLVPQMVGRGIAHGNFGLLALALDLAVPPLALLALLLTFAVVVTGASVLLGLSGVAFSISAASFAAFVLAVLLSWLTHGRDLLPPAALLSIVPYVLGKVGLYGRFFLQRRPPRWVRTARS